MTKDSKTIMGSLYEAINTYILNINTTLATQKNSIPKFNDLIEVVYAKKKRFLNRATHPLLDRYEFFIWLKDDIKYLSEYTNQSLINEPLNQQTQQYFSFLFLIRLVHQQKSWTKLICYIQLYCFVEGLHCDYRSSIGD